MRLVCPNCGAQYEVDDRVIPENGRDVQCSNCGHTWFQRPAGSEETADADTVAESTVAEMIADGGAEADRDDRTMAEPETLQEASQPEAPIPGHPADTAAPDAAAENPQGAPQRARRTLDDDVQEVLRQEAEREAKAREREGHKIETQEDLGLEETSAAPNQHAVAAQERMARLRGLDTEDASPASGGAGARRDLLPDIEEIDSSLTSIGSDEMVDDFAEPTPRSGFTRGFAIILLLGVIGVALYLYGPLIGEKAPALAPALDRYAHLVDQARDWIDSMVALALTKLQ